MVVLPLLAVPVCALLPGRRLPGVFATLVAWAVLALAMLLMQEVSTAGVLRYQLGGWAPPWGIEYRLDHLAALVQLLLALIAAVVFPYAARSLGEDSGSARAGGVFAALLLLLTGLLGIVATGDAFNVFVFLEISSLASYTLIALGRRRRALVASFRYLILGTVGATFFLIGLGLLYALTGTLNMDDLAARMPPLAGSPAATTALFFIVAGLGLKAAMFPLHQWLPDAYAEAPPAVSAFMAATSTKVALYALARFLFGVFGLEQLFDLPTLQPGLQWLAVAGMLGGSILALRAADIGRVLALSSVAQVGYILLGLALFSTAGVAAGLVHLFNHALMKGALFLALGAIIHRHGSGELTRLEGVAHAMPWTMAAFMLGAFSLIGVPLTAGFVGKWYLVMAVFDQGAWWLVAAILVSSILSVFYLWRIVEVAYRRPAVLPARAEAPPLLLVPTALLALANLGVGLHSSLLVSWAQAASLALLGSVP
ncbi:MAG: monovalent cation/H+ antiporter subunit D family protein [Cyanobacteriota bacterium]|nr:monovalent cation/H+ antiporter subunit D family protein [Cyanobacteriota bacterium]